MPLIDGLNYKDGQNPVNLGGEETIQKRLEQMSLRIRTDAPAYDLCKNYVDGKQEDPYAPSDQRDEIRELRRRAIMNLMPLAVSIPAQLSFVQGYRRNGNNFPPEWRVWTRSGFHARQTSIWTSALTYGASYVSLENLGQGNPRLRLLSSRNTVAFYSDPVNDIHPDFAMTIRSKPHGDEPGLVVYYDPEQIIYYDLTTAGDFHNPRVFPHSLGETPIRRFTCLVDDEGTSRGVVEMLIPAQDRVNQDSFDRMATQSFSAFKVRWASGMMGDPRLDENNEPVLDAEGQHIYDAVPIDHSTMLMADNPDAKFGTLDETPLDGFQGSLEQSVRHFAVQGQLPPHSLLGNLSNLSAETLVAAMAQTDRFSTILKTSWEQSVVDLMRLVARDMGIEMAGLVSAEIEDDDIEGFVGDYEGEIRWRDMSDHTLAAQVDALGKGAQMLGIPIRGLWNRFPNSTSGDIEYWEELAEEQDAMAFDEGATAQSAARRESSRPSGYEPPVQSGLALGGG